MTRRALQVNGRESGPILTEGPFATELDLQKAFVDHPELLPGEDLGLQTLVSLGWELDLGAGPMDQLAVDRTGQLVVIEFKRGGESSDVRRVVAQLFDYGSALWGTPYVRLEAKCQENGGYTLVAEGDDLATHTSRFLAEVGESPLDFDAFRAGITTSLEKGSFVFAYVVRDLDSRTRRVLTYLAEGASLSVFAVEVDNFQTANRETSVLVPRVAYVPARVIEKEAAEATADPKTDQLIELMTPIAARSGFVAKPDGRNRRWPEAGVGVFHSSTGLQVEDAVVRARVGGEAIDQLRDRLGALAGRRLSAHWWYLAPSVLVDNWQQGGRDALEALFAPPPESS
jgi:hypothetical protein